MGGGRGDPPEPGPPGRQARPTGGGGWRRCSRQATCLPPAPATSRRVPPAGHPVALTLSLCPCGAGDVLPPGSVRERMRTRGPCAPLCWAARRGGAEGGSGGGGGGGGASGPWPRWLEGAREAGSPGTRRGDGARQGLVAAPGAPWGLPVGGARWGGAAGTAGHPGRGGVGWGERSPARGGAGPAWTGGSLRAARGGRAPRVSEEVPRAAAPGRERDRRPGRGAAVASLARRCRRRRRRRGGRSRQSFLPRSLELELPGGVPGRVPGRAGLQTG